MEGLFLQILNMSMVASVVIVVVLLLRFPLKKAPKSISYALWSVVLFRLVCPFSFESIFSLLPSAKPLSQEILTTQSPIISSGFPIVDRAVHLPPPTLGDSVNPMQALLYIAAIVWIIGVVTLLIYSIISFVLLKRKVNVAMLIEGNIYECDAVSSPFVLGLFSPKIYLPLGLSATQKAYILKHEQTHIKRFDTLIKPLAFLALCVHWFNPLCWLAFVLMSKDMELSCDEAVIKTMGGEIKHDYSISLLSLATKQKMLSGSPLAFGESNVKARIKNVLCYKKPVFWAIVVCVIAVVAIGVGLITNPKSDQRAVVLKNEIRIAFVGIENISYEKLGVVDGTELLQYTSPIQNDYLFIESRFTDYVGDEKFKKWTSEEAIKGRYETNVNLLIYINHFNIDKKQFIKINNIVPDMPLYTKESIDALYGTELDALLNFVKVPAALCSNGKIYTAQWLNERTFEDFTAEKINAEKLMLHKDITSDIIKRFVSEDAAKAFEAKVEQYCIGEKNTADSYSLSNLENGDIQLSINNTTEFSELGNKNGGFAYFEKATNQLHVGITTAYGQPKATDANPVGSLAGAKLEFDMDITTGTLLNKSTPYNSENVKIEISDEEIANIGKKLYEKLLEASSAQNPIIPLTLTKETATEFINQTLSSFKLGSDNTVSFTLPATIPTEESGKTKLIISSSATFASSPSSGNVQEILDWKDGWLGGESYSQNLEMERGTLKRIFLRVAFMTEEGENSYREYAANYIEFVEPFKYDSPVSVRNRSVEINTKGTFSVLKYTMQNGDNFSITLELPKGLSLSVSENSQPSDMPGIIVAKNGESIGSLTLSGFGTDDKDVLKGFNTDENTLPMQIFSPIALSNHAQFDNYKVCKSSPTGANAIAEYLWQDLTDYGGRAPDAPWLKSDSILAYDYGKAPFFIDLNLADGSLNALELESLAKSITLSK